MDLIKLDNNTPVAYKDMMAFISDKLPTLEKAKSSFFKTQSQFMDHNLTVTQLTPIRSLRQILAECEKIEGALKEAYFKREKIKIQISAKKHLIKVQDLDQFAFAMIEIEIAELENSLISSSNYINGAIRKLTAYIEQYESIANKFGIKDFTEEDFEKQEEQYHIMTAFNQAITASRSRGGTIDEGNHIYFMQIGISGNEAQKDINNLFKSEETIIVGHYDHIIEFLESMAVKYQGCSIVCMQRRGLEIISKQALLT